MLAAVLKDFNHLELKDIPIPEPGLGEVVVRIKSCGICATDYKAVKGIRRNVKFPFIPGHEPSGIVARIGPGVQAIKEGDEVIVQPSGYCGVCSNCRLGKAHYCESAFTTGGDGPEDVRPGAFAEYMLTEATTLFNKPKDISFDAACLTEPLSGAWKGLIQYSDLRIGDDVVIIGVGGIGLLCLMIAKAAGAGHCVAIDINEDMRLRAMELGATRVIDPTLENSRERVYEIMPHGPDLVVEAAGPIEAVRLMVSLLRRGTRWNLFGITTHDIFELDGGLMHFLEARMDASFGTTPLAMSKAIRLMERGLVDPEKIISHRFPLEEIHTGLELLGMATHNKVIINP